MTSASLHLPLSLHCFSICPLVELAFTFTFCFALPFLTIMLIACDTSAIPPTTIPQPLLPTCSPLLRILHKCICCILARPCVQYIPFVRSNNSLVDPEPCGMLFASNRFLRNVADGEASVSPIQRLSEKSMYKCLAPLYVNVALLSRSTGGLEKPWITFDL